jgi:surface antigen
VHDSDVGTYVSRMKRELYWDRPEKCNVTLSKGAVSTMADAKIRKTDPDKRFRRVLSASTLEGNSVQNSAGENLGKIDEIMIDLPTGRVAYAVLSFGGILSMGNKLFAVPWGALRVDEDEKCFIMDVEKRTLETAPGFDKDNWPDMADTGWGMSIYQHYGTRPYWEDTKTLHGGGGL